MHKFIFLIFVIALKVILTKGLSLAFILLSFACKGKALHKNEELWNQYFSRLSDSFVLKYAISIYLAAAASSSAVSGCLLYMLGFKHPVIISMVLFICGLVITLFRYRKKTREEIIEALSKVKNFSAQNQG